MKKYLFYGFVFYYLVLNYFNPGEVERFSSVYFLLTIPILVFIGLFFPFWTRKYNNVSILLALLLAIVMVISMARLDFRSAQTAFLLFTTLIILINAEVAFDIRIVNLLFMFSVLGSIVSFHMGINPYGYIPNFEAMLDVISGDVGLRISLFPYIPESAFFSLFVIVSNYYFNPSRSRFFYYSLAGYFLIFSSSRTAVIILLFFVLFELVVRFIQFRPRLLFTWLNVLFVFIFVLMMNFKSLHIYLSQIDNDVVKTLLLRDQVQTVTEDSDIDDVANRTWIWDQHFRIFSNSPLVGVGTYEFGDYIHDKSKVYHYTTGSESFLTAWLARVGLAMMLLVGSLILVQHEAMVRNDRFRYFMCFGFFMVMISYGSFVVPYNFMFLLMAAALSRRPAEVAVKQG